MEGLLFDMVVVAGSDTYNYFGHAPDIGSTKSYITCCVQVVDMLCNLYIA